MKYWKYYNYNKTFFKRWIRYEINFWIKLLRRSWYAFNQINQSKSWQTDQISVLNNLSGVDVSLNK